jgi:hypothetical protein
MTIYIQKTKKGNTETLDQNFESWEDAENYMTNTLLVNENYRYYSFIIFPEGKVKDFIRKIREYLFVDKNDVHIYSFRLVEKIK